MFKIKEPRKPLKFEITQAHVACAVPKDPCNCVIAKAFQDRYKNTLLEIQVLQNITQLVWSGSRIDRYKTPPYLKEALVEYDQTKVWNLKPGVYQLDPLPPSLTCKAQQERSEKRRAEGENLNEKSHNKTGKKKRRSVNPRLINMKEIRKTGAIPAERTSK